MAEASLYERDTILWAVQQAAALRAAAASGSNLPIEWENVAEEIEGLSVSLRRELGSRLATIVEHLLKLRHSPATEPRSGWIETVIRERRELTGLLALAPSLRHGLDEAVQLQAGRAKRSALEALEARRELTPDLRRAIARSEFTTEDVFDGPISTSPD